MNLRSSSVNIIGFLGSVGGGSSTIMVGRKGNGKRQEAVGLYRKE